MPIRSPAVTTRNVPRHYQMMPGKQNCPPHSPLRITDLHTIAGNPCQVPHFMETKFIMTFKFLKIQPHSTLIIYYQLYFFPIFPLKSNRTSWYFQNIPCVLLYIEPIHSWRSLSPAIISMTLFLIHMCFSSSLTAFTTLFYILICCLLVKSKIAFHWSLCAQFWAAISPWWAFNKYLMKFKGTTDRSFQVYTHTSAQLNHSVCFLSEWL